jgi:hypothetical protein
MYPTALEIELVKFLNNICQEEQSNLNYKQPETQQSSIVSINIYDRQHGGSTYTTAQ